MKRGLYRPYYDAMLERNGRKKTMAFCAVARKMVPMLLHIMQTTEPFDGSVGPRPPVARDRVTTTRPAALGGLQHPVPDVGRDAVTLTAVEAPADPGCVTFALPSSPVSLGPTAREDVLCQSR
jgi:hypothetical protein